MTDQALRTITFPSIPRRLSLFCSDLLSSEPLDRSFSGGSAAAIITEPVCSRNSVMFWNEWFAVGAGCLSGPRYAMLKE